jgi:hemerythrin-like domain-containing protein
VELFASARLYARGRQKEVRQLDPEDESWLTTVKAVHASLEGHIREEEQDIFPRISKVWDEKQLKQERN